MSSPGTADAALWAQAGPQEPQGRPAMVHRRFDVQAKPPSFQPFQPGRPVSGGSVSLAGCRHGYSGVSRSAGSPFASSETRLTQPNPEETFVPAPEKRENSDSRSSIPV